MNTGKPNIVFLMNDHQSYYRHGWDGGPEIQRPYFDRVAAEGMRWERAYTACPLCGPSRRSILTGLMPHKHGEIKNERKIPIETPTYLDILAQSGYRNFYFGKWHVGTGTAFDHGCEGFCYPSYSNPYTKPEYRKYLERKGLPEPEIMIEKNFTDFPELVEGQLYHQKAGWSNEHASGIMLTPKETHEAFFLADLARDTLKELAATKSNTPFCLRVDFWGPHPPYFPTQEYADRYDSEEIPEYGNFKDDLKDKPEIYFSELNRGLHKDGKLIVPNPLPWNEWQKVIARCYAQITMIDEAGGLILDELKELGLAENTLVVWSADHGDGLACHGGHFDKRSYMPEEVIRVPMAISYPGRIEPGQVSNQLSSLIDLAPTILDAAGLQFPNRVDGLSLLPLCTGSRKPWRDFLVCETHGHLEDHIGRALLTDRFKYVYNQGQKNELYDLENDPYEMLNRIDSSGHQDMIRDMEERLSRWCSASGDHAPVFGSGKSKER